MEKPRKWKHGVNRWFVLLFIILSVIFAKFYPPVLPHIQVAAEPLSHTPLFTLPIIGEFYMTNTLWAMLVMDVIVILMIWSFAKAVRSKSLLPKGFSGAIEALFEALYNFTESTAGKAANAIFPWIATIFILVLISNWIELIPAVDSVGLLEKVGHGGHAIKEIFPGVAALVNSPGEYGVTSYVRVLSTDLNFTLALALISVVMTQVIGIRFQGMKYFSKFFNTQTMFTKPFFGAMDFLVGFLELISEVSKILSFAFRLFGNIFAGSVLLFLVGSMVPIFAQSMILFFEFAIGMIQAFVFAVLTLVFMAQATEGHGGEEDHQAVAAEA